MGVDTFTITHTHKLSLIHSLFAITRNHTQFHTTAYKHTQPHNPTQPHSITHNHIIPRTRLSPFRPSAGRRAFEQSGRSVRLLHRLRPRRQDQARRQAGSDYEGLRPVVGPGRPALRGEAQVHRRAVRRVLQSLRGHSVSPGRRFFCGLAWLGLVFFGFLWMVSDM